ncbi:MAG: ubiquinone biosynthesis protein, partial [Cryomorphaceae bacterium]
MSKASTSLARLWQIRGVIRKHGLVDLLDELEINRSARLAARLLVGNASKDVDTRGQRVRLALEDLGPVFVKLGQALSTRPDLLPDEVSLELAKLQDQVPAFSAEQAIEIIKQTYGLEFDSIFESVETEPLASASVAQVHSARLKPGLAVAGQNGEVTPDVVIKVIRPGIKRIIDSDLNVMYALAGLVQRHWSRGEQFKPLDIIREYESTIHGELDLRVEAANGGRMGANFEDTDIIYVPRIYWDYTRENVLVMERIFGTSIKDFKALETLGHDLESLARDGVNVFFKQAFEDNFFHADMHAGNIFVSEQGKWMAIDFGIMGTLDEKDKQYLGQMLLGFFNRDYQSIARAHLQAGWVPADTRIEEFELAVRVVCEPIFAKPIAEISFGNVLLQLFQTMRRFEMPVQPQLVLLYKTLLNIEGLGRQLYPQLNLWDTAKPFLEQWMKKQMSPQALIDDLKRDWPQWRALLPELPILLKEVIEQKKSPPKPSAPAKRSAQSKLGLGLTALG